MITLMKQSHWLRVFGISILLAILLLSIKLSYHINPVMSSASVTAQETPLFQEAPNPPQSEPTTNRLKTKVAQEVALTPVEDEFGRFNLFIIFFVTLGPLKIIPVFVKLTQNANRTLRRQLAFLSTGISTIVILLVVLIGRNLLRVWTIQLSALMIAGGILLSIVALRLILAQYNSKVQQTEPPENPNINIAIAPLAFPTILPPFGIAIALTLMIIAVELGFRPVLVIALLILVMGLNLVCMLAARPILKFIRPVTLRILGYTLSVMQFALGIQFVLFAIEIQILAIRFLLINE